MKPLEPQHSHEHPPSGIVAWSPKGCLEAGAADLWIVEIENLSLGGWEVERPWVYLNLTTIWLFCSAQESWTENRNFLYGFVCFFPYVNLWKSNQTSTPRTRRGFQIWAPSTVQRCFALSRFPWILFLKVCFTAFLLFTKDTDRDIPDIQSLFSCKMKASEQLLFPLFF